MLASAGNHRICRSGRHRPHSPGPREGQRPGPRTWGQCCSGLHCSRGLRAGAGGWWRRGHWGRGSWSPRSVGDRGCSQSGHTVGTAGCRRLHSPALRGHQSRDPHTCCPPHCWLHSSQRTLEENGLNLYIIQTAHTPIETVVVVICMGVQGVVCGT